MLQRWIGDIKEAPARLSKRRTELTEAARTRARTVRDDGEERLWTMQTHALDRAEDLLEHAPELPVVTTLFDAAGKLVTRRLDRITEVPIPEYEVLNARNAIRSIKDLDRRIALLAVRRHEAAHKGRKTVLRALDERLERAA